MKKRVQKMNLSVLTLAVQGALGVMFVLPVLGYAADEEVDALINPTSSVEVGVENISAASAKFGEYNGLNKSGGKFIGNLDIRGGEAYGQGSGLTRWNVQSNDLGTTSGDIRANFSEQGQWNIGIGYDQLQHNTADTYQMPFSGALGDNAFRLNPSFGIINATAVTGSNSQLVGTRNLTTNQLQAFQQVDVNNTRKNSSFNAGYTLDSHWNVQFDYNHLEQSGAKLIGAASSNLSTAAGAPNYNAAAALATSWTKEATVTLLNPTNYRTDTFSLSANWKADNAYMTASYFASYFRNADDRLSWDNPIGLGKNGVAPNTPAGGLYTTLANGYQSNMLSVAPDNDFYQINVSGGNKLSPTTKFTGGVSIGRNTQDANYLVDLMQAGGLPATSLNGIVLNNNINAKVTDQTTKDLMLSVGYKYNERVNKTASNVYKFVDLGGVSRTVINTPYSNKKADLDLAADYRIDKRQNLNVAYVHEDVNRWCESVVGSGASTAGANCVAVPSSGEDKLGLNYRLKMTDDLSYNMGYSFSKRVATVDHNYISPLGTSTALGTVNSNDLRGFVAFFDASREQNALKAGANWQANEKLNFSVNGRYTQDKYVDSALGVQDGYSLSLNLDSAYAYSDTRTFTAYFSMQDRSRTLMDGANGTSGTTPLTGGYAAFSAPTQVWKDVLSDGERTIGFNIKEKGFMGGKLELMGDLSVTVGQSQYHTEVPYLATCGATSSLTCGESPAIFSNTLDVKLSGKYQLDKKSKVLVAYEYKQLFSNDYYYNGYQLGYTPSSTLPTMQVSPNYVVNAVAVSYIYNF